MRQERNGAKGNETVTLETRPPNKALHLTAILLRSIAAGDLGRSAINE